MKEHRVLIVDDSVDDIHILMEFLKDDYVLDVATSGEQALELALNEPIPNLVLMDVNMDGIDGYDTCREIRKEKDLDVIFVSANDTTEEILSGYDAGGIDYVIKPFDPEVLGSKVQLALDNRKKTEDLEAAKKQASDVAMQAIFSSGDMGVIVDFLRECFDVETLENLAFSVLKASENYGLNSSIQLRSQFGDINESQTGTLCALELELLSRMRDSDERLIESGKRLFVNFESVTLLVKNMPLDDPDKIGRLRDYLAILVETAAVKLRGIDERLALLEERKIGIKGVLVDTMSTLKSIQEAQANHKASNVKLVDEMMQSMTEEMFSMGLTEEQETKLLGILQGGVDKVIDHFEAGLEVDDQLKNIVMKLSSIN